MPTQTRRAPSILADFARRLQKYSLYFVYFWLRAHHMHGSTAESGGVVSGTVVHTTRAMVGMTRATTGSARARWHACGTASKPSGHVSTQPLLHRPPQPPARRAPTRATARPVVRRCRRRPTPPPPQCRPSLHRESPAQAHIIQRTHPNTAEQGPRRACPSSGRSSRCPRSAPGVDALPSGTRPCARCSARPRNRARAYATATPCDAGDPPARVGRRLRTFHPRVNAATVHTHMHIHQPPSRCHRTCIAACHHDAMIMFMHDVCMCHTHPGGSASSALLERTGSQHVHACFVCCACGFSTYVCFVCGCGCALWCRVVWRWQHARTRPTLRHARRYYVVRQDRCILKVGNEIELTACLNVN